MKSNSIGCHDENLEHYSLHLRTNPELIRNGLKYLLFVFALGLPFSILAQNAKIDSLRSISAQQKDSSLLTTYLSLSSAFGRISPDSAKSYSFKALELATELGMKRELGIANLGIGISEKNLGNLSIAEPFYKEAYRYSKEVNDTMNMGLCLNGLGILYKKKANFEKSVEYYNEAARLYEAFGEERSITKLATVYNNLGNLVKNNGDYRSSLIYHRKALSLRLKMDRQVSHSYQNMANTFVLMGQNDSALMYFHKAYELLQIQEDIISKGSLLTSMAEFYADLGETDQALIYAQKSVDIFTEVNDKSGLSSAYGSLAYVAAKRGNHDKAEEYGLKAYNLSIETGSFLIQQDICQILINVFEGSDDFENSFKYQKEYQAIKDSIYKVDKLRAIHEAESKFEVREHQEAAVLANAAKLSAEAQHKAEREQHRAEREVERLKSEEQERMLLILSIAGVLVLIGLGFFWRANIQTKKANQQLERQQQEILIKNKSLEKANSEIVRQSDEIAQKNKDITDSINYARKIQTTALPNPKDLKTFFEDAFVIYKPKDIISGDFYWFLELKEYVIVAVADCTGHGVPGALMSMTGLNLLHQIVADKNISSPSEALHLLDKGIYQALSVTEHSETKDGMDIALCAINRETRVMQFAGAARPLLISSNGEITRVKGSRNSIGGHLTFDKQFDDHEIQLKPGDQFYLFSDGYADQFGGPLGKKFKNKALRELIVRNQSLEMSEQGKVYEKAFDDWMGDHEQIDDICFIGVKV